MVCPFSHTRRIRTWGKAKVKTPDSLRQGRVKPPPRLLRCATALSSPGACAAALRVTAPLGCGSRRLVWPNGSLSARPRPEA